MVTKFVEQLANEGFKVDAKHAKKDEVDGSYSLPFTLGKTVFTVYFNSIGEIWQFDSKRGRKSKNILSEKPYKQVEPLFLKDINVKELKKFI